MPSFQTGRSDGDGGSAGSGCWLVASGLRLGSDDYNQLAYAMVGMGRTMSALLGGEGLYAGGVAVVGDFGGSGTTYPPATIVLHDDAGDPWWYVTASAKAIDFSAISSGSGKLYAVVGQVSGVSPALGLGYASALTFVALPAATAAPAHSLLLGAGTVTASAFTTFTPDAGATPGAGTLFHGFDVSADAGTTATVAAGEELAIIGDDVLNRTTVAKVGGVTTVAVYGTSTAKLGPPTGTGFVAGDLARDVAGAVFRCSGVDGYGNPVWDQQVRGALGTLGAGITTPPVAGDFNSGAIRNGYLWRDRGVQSDWYYDSSVGTGRWLSANTITLTAADIQSITAAGVTAQVPLPYMSLDYYVEATRFYVVQNATADGSNYFTISMIAHSLSDSSTLVTISQTRTTTSAAVYGTQLTLDTRLVDATTYTILAFRTVSKTGSPGSLSHRGHATTLRYVRR